ncbi:YeeE/YedE family protein [Myxococcota bacterium]|nr:YeeE/YedE family protein [Myxococcota bacterium]
MEPKPFINPYLAGVMLGVVLFTAFAVTHSGLGASGAVSRLQVAATSAVAQDYVDRVGYFAAIGGGDRSALDHSSVMMLLGTFAGGMVSSWRNRRLKVEVCHGPSISPRLRLPLALLGGIIMGYGARLARGCTSGNALSGGAVLSAGSWAFMFAVFAGAYMLAYFVRKLWN